MVGATKTPVRIYFAGLNTARFAEVLEDQDVLVSFADIVRRPGVWADEIRPRLEGGVYRSAILDSGAYTELTERARNERAIAEGRKPPHPNPWHTDLGDYGRFALEDGELFDEIVTLDDIEGDVAKSKRNTRYLERLGLDVLPVFHQGEPWAVLEDYVRRYDRIGLGVQRVNGNPGPGAFAWTSEALERIPLPISVHGFGMTRYARRLPRMTTTDSTTWIAEYRAVRTTELGTPHYCLDRRVRGLDDYGRLVLVVRSYREPERAIEREVPDAIAKGQGRTVLLRYSPSSLRATCAELAGLRKAA